MLLILTILLLIGLVAAATFVVLSVLLQSVGFRLARICRGGGAFVGRPLRRFPQFQRLERLDPLGTRVLRLAAYPVAIIVNCHLLSWPILGFLYPLSVGLVVVGAGLAVLGGVGIASRTSNQEDAPANPAWLQPAPLATPRSAGSAPWPATLGGP